MIRQTALVVGASRGLGRAFAEILLERGLQVLGTSRSPSGAPSFADACLPLDVTDPGSLERLPERVRAHTDRLHLLLNVAGLLHADGLQPEKRLEHLDAAAMQRVFAVNAFGPALVTRALLPLLAHDERAVVGNLSARVGSIGDNRLGGWYSYRASKAAQNQLTRTMAIELKRRAPRAIVVALHPGTVETELSAPFRRNVPDEKLFSPRQAARQLLDVIDGLSAEQSGGFFAWDGQPIEW